MKTLLIETPIALAGRGAALAAAIAGGIGIAAAVRRTHITNHTATP